MRTNIGPFGSETFLKVSYRASLIWELINSEVYDVHMT